MESACVFVLNQQNLKDPDQAFESLVFEMLLIENKRPKLSIQAHSICANVLIWMFSWNVCFLISLGTVNKPCRDF